MDKGYDADKIIELIESQGAVAVIPSKSNRKNPRKVDYYLYKERHLVECFFNKLKNFRRIATRYDKLATSFLSFVNISAILLLIK